MFEKPQLANNKIFNIVLIFIGMLAFVLFYFVFDAGYLLSLNIALAPTIVGIINLKEIRKQNQVQ
ncbi:hypothetical protein O0H48_06730 [Staphylococcus pseudintermedius]|uniref:hypothetical protein n=1 Tax=Staphylococcus pseudintermedius TaxID=283734 RepID=UPI0007AEAF44|nr:hypothetical protein [Staphylococcus pseudintermedius]EGQ0310112.1 hypothetical protein [Staphylococcus pseudintermedius]EGQ0358183.1 hypothetical protein [Staphylococcus pseudintermedius]EGQ1619638.1 hypothetical protein [Staphylococcus pseudintermedius]EGQ1656624.1 hypothetical protein [Staphylococcus pseudintermedius]EGQ3261881.1 hypothetical protein [Staphylococcus pseudintermedius]